jgi:predicted alpha/beta-fold hydrolase
MASRGLIAAMIATAGGAFTYHYKTNIVAAPELYFVPTDSNHEKIAACPTLNSPFAPIFYMPGGHAQSVLSVALRPPFVNTKYQRQFLPAPDGGRICLDWHDDPECALLPPDAPALLIFPGLTASSTSIYIRQLAINCRRNGIRAVVFNYRGFHHPITSPMGSSCADVDDAAIAIKHLRSTLPAGTPVGAVGYSMGANMLAKVMGEQKIHLESAVLVSNPWDFNKLSSKMEGMPNKLYSLMLCKWIKGNVFNVPENRDVMRQLPHVDLDHALDSSTIYELDDRLTRKFYHLPSVQEYYNVSSSRPHILNITTPTLCLNSLDDPIIDNDSALPLDEARRNPNIILATTQRGGHCAWSDGLFPDSSKSWLTRVMFEYLTASFTKARPAVSASKP